MSWSDAVQTVEATTTAASACDVGGWKSADMSPVTAHRTAKWAAALTASDPTWAPAVACRSPIAIGRSSTCWYVVLICSGAGSFDRHRLRQVARAVHVEAA